MGGFLKCVQLFSAFLFSFSTLRVFHRQPAPGRTWELPPLLAHSVSENENTGQNSRVRILNHWPGVSPDPAVMAFHLCSGEARSSVRTSLKSAAILTHLSQATANSENNPHKCPGRANKLSISPFKHISKRNMQNRRSRNSTWKQRCKCTVTLGLSCLNQDETLLT